MKQLFVYRRTHDLSFHPGLLA